MLIFYQDHERLLVCGVVVRIVQAYIVLVYICKPEVEEGAVIDKGIIVDVCFIISIKTATVNTADISRLHTLC